MLCLSLEEGMIVAAVVVVFSQDSYLSYDI